MRASTAAQQLAAAPGAHLLATDLDQPAWTAFTAAAAAAAGGTPTAEPPPSRPLSLARQPTPLLPCGLTAEELAALTASQAAAGGGMAGERRRDRFANCLPAPAGDFPGARFDNGSHCCLFCLFQM